MTPRPLQTLITLALPAAIVLSSSSAGASAVSVSFHVSADVQGLCRIETLTENFFGARPASPDQLAQVAMACTAGTAARLGIDSDTLVAASFLKDPVFFKDPAQTRGWGLAADERLNLGTFGTASPRLFAVYGRGARSGELLFLAVTGVVEVTF